MKNEKEKKNSSRLRNHLECFEIWSLQWGYHFSALEEEGWRDGEGEEEKDEKKRKERGKDFQREKTKTSLLETSSVRTQYFLRQGMKREQQKTKQN